MTKPAAKVLVVEDEPLMQELLARAFQTSLRFEFQVTGVLDVQEYLERGLHRETYDVAVVDLKLRDGAMTGNPLAFARAVEHPFSAILVYSAHDERATAVQAMKCGAGDFISKNECRPDELVRRVEDFLDRRNRDAAHQERAAAYVAQHGAELAAAHGGKHVIIADDRVVASGSSRLAALLEYEKARAKDPHGKTWPEVPVFFDLTEPQPLA